ncbi:MAG: ribonuclease H-like domain-containing protein [Patescibacteria group bacterium]|jgi:DEAD/DEAH box helicase domain-containing protein
MSDNYAVVDIETKDSFADVGAYDASKLNISVVGIYTKADDTFRCLEEHELDQLWPLLEHSDRVIGFNLLGFDYPVMQKYYRGKLADLNTLDILYEFKKHHGFRIKLDSLAQDTLGVGKSGDGLKAIRLFAQGKMDELKSYCLDDVRITRDLFLRGIETGELSFQDKGVKRAWKVDWVIHKPEGSGGVLTLPF